MNVRIAIVDSYYPDFLKSFPVDTSSTYEAELQRLLQFSFGTFDAYSRGLRAHGWETLDIIANHRDLQAMWAKEHGYHGNEILEGQIAEFDPHVIFTQDLSLSLAGYPKSTRLFAAQCSCRLAPEKLIKYCDVVFTSIPSHIQKFETLGVRAVFNPLAFDPVVLERMGPISGERSGCVFVGGVGKNSHWRYGTEVLETVAANIPEFSWYGYGVENLAADSPLRKCYKGQAWGLDYYRILAKSAIVLNRHGEVSDDYANNMRMFEATGVGAMLLTERKKNLGDYFNDYEAINYSSQHEAVEQVRWFLDHPQNREGVANYGHARTLAHHTYNIRMKTISDTLREML